MGALFPNGGDVLSSGNAESTPHAVCLSLPDPLCPALPCSCEMFWHRAPCGGPFPRSNAEKAGGKAGGRALRLQESLVLKKRRIERRIIVPWTRISHANPRYDLKC